jgi:hypothetical protein
MDASAFTRYEARSQVFKATLSVGSDMSAVLAHSDPM